MPHFSPSSFSRPAGFLAALGLLLATAGAARAQTPASFAPVSTYPVTDGSPFGLAVADVNGDGRPDIITANSGNDTAGVLLGQAVGSFVAGGAFLAGPSGAGNSPRGVAVADVNGDGRADIITANYNNRVGVLLGQVGGSIGSVSNYATGTDTNPNSVAVADVNSDGRPDIVTANFGNDTAGVLLGQAGGGFAPAITYATGSNSRPYCVVVADVNGDGRPDIITANFGNSTAGVLLGQAGGSFATVVAYSSGTTTYPRGVAVADVNGDGRPDIITANYNRSTAGVLLGQAGGGFAAVNTYPSGAGDPQSVAVADVNGDGRADIITANTTSDTAGVLLGQAGGGFAAVSTYGTGVNGRPFGVAVADVNGDGRSDIITANWFGDTAGVLLNTGTFMPLAAASATAAAEVSVFPNPARGSFAVQLPAAWGAAPVRAALLNPLGQVVCEQAAALPAGGTLAFATAGLSAGIYTLRLQAGGHTLARRVVVE